MGREWTLVGAIAVLGGVYAVGCGPLPDDDGDGTPVPSDYEIIATEYSFSPSELSAGPGEQLTITLVNQGTENHNIEFELPDGYESLPTDVPPGESGTLTLTTPDETGNFTFYCPVGQHFQQGMEGVLVIQ